jgi:hypothetical protein
MIWIKSAMGLDEAVRRHLAALQRTAATVSQQMSAQTAI